MNEMTYHIESLSAIPSVAKAFLEEVGHYRVIAFEGEMGAGKTTFITALLTAMGITELQGSPTYSLVNVYQSPMFGRVNHFDFYRIKDEREAFDIGVEEMIYEEGISLIEWPKKISSLLPHNTLWVSITAANDYSRTITIHV